MKKINLYVDFEFTSRSPDAQPISVGIVSDSIEPLPAQGFFGRFKNIAFDQPLMAVSFYAEFSDYDINRCDDWVKDNVVSKLKYPGVKLLTNRLKDANLGNVDIVGDTYMIKSNLQHYLALFSDYDIQFVVDCGTFDWYHILQLIGEWDENTIATDGCPVCGYDGLTSCNYHKVKTGIPFLPKNIISPVPSDLNDLIAFKKGITAGEAFDLNREELLIEDVVGITLADNSTIGGEPYIKHNALSDALLIKHLYNKL